MRKPLVHFLVIAGFFFFTARRPEDSLTLKLTEEYLKTYHSAQARRLGLAELPHKMKQEVDARIVEDEVLYREGLRMGLDKEDHIIKQRVIQKMLFLTDAMSQKQDTDEEALKAYFEKNRDRWQRQRMLNFIHVFVAKSRQAKLPMFRDQLLRANSDNALALKLGDAFPLSRNVPLSPERDLEENYGKTFAKAVKGLSPGIWSEPISSKFGFHLVKVLSIKDPRPFTFDEAKEQVAQALRTESKAKARTEFLKELYTKYRIEIPGYAKGHFGGPFAQAK